MIVNVTVVGDKALIARLDRMPRAVNQALYAKVLALALKLEKKVKVDKLNGQVLNRITGALARSIHQSVDRSPHSVIGRVFSSGDVKYAGVHEYGFKGVVLVKEHVRTVVFGNKVNPFSVGPYNRNANMPERSFLRSSLHEMSTEISLGMKKAVIESIQKEIDGA